MRQQVDPSPVDYQKVRSYFARVADGVGGASYMAHAQNLPEAASSYRFRTERRAIADWVATVGPGSRVLDLGCGAGAWTEVFAERGAHVSAVEQSAAMLAAARTRIGENAKVEFLSQDARGPLPEGPFDFVFFGGLCLYLDDADAIALVKRARSRLAPGGRMAFRETTVAAGYGRTGGEYEAIYRSVAVYRALFREAGLPYLAVRRNWGYTYMELAVELVELRRRFLPLLPRSSNALGTLTWAALRGTSPLSFGLFPRRPERLFGRWPALQNHFFLFDSGG